VDSLYNILIIKCLKKLQSIASLELLDKIRIQQLHEIMPLCVVTFLKISCYSSMHKPTATVDNESFLACTLEDMCMVMEEVLAASTRLSKLISIISHIYDCLLLF